MFCTWLEAQITLVWLLTPKKILSGTKLVCFVMDEQNATMEMFFFFIIYFK